MPETKPPILSSTHDTTQGRKPWYRLRNVALAILAILVGFVAYAFYWQASLKPNPTHDYERELIALSAAAQPEGTNGWPQLMTASRMMEQLENNEDSLALLLGELRYAQFADWRTALDNPKLRTGLLEMLDLIERQGIDAIIDTALESPRFVKEKYLGDDTMLLSALLPEISSLRHYTHAQMIGALLALERGDCAEATDRLQRALNVGGAMAWQPSAIFYIAVKNNTIAYLHALRQAIGTASIDREGLDRFERILASLLEPAPVSLAIEGERLFQLDLIQHLFTDNGDGDGDGDGLLICNLFNEMFSDVADVASLNPMQINGPLGNFTGLFLAGRRESEAAINDLYDSWLDDTSRSSAARRAVPLDVNGLLWNLGPRFQHMQMVIPALGKMIDGEPRVRCEIEGTRLTLAIARYWADRGRLPEALADLVPDYLEIVPRDPFSGSGFVYRRLTQSDESEPTESALAYLLYSVGPDGEDNDCEVDPDSQVYWSIRAIGNGYDLPFTTGR